MASAIAPLGVLPPLRVITSQNCTWLTCPPDDFEEIAIHSTILIDKDGRVHWARHGGAPFDDFKFIVSQLQRMNQRVAAVRATNTAP